MPNPFRSAMHSDDGSLDRLYPQMWPLNGIAGSLQSQRQNSPLRTVPKLAFRAELARHDDSAKPKRRPPRSFVSTHWAGNRFGRIRLLLTVLTDA
jgi:hypothetical protein